MLFFAKGELVKYHREEEPFGKPVTKYCVFYEYFISGTNTEYAKVSPPEDPDSPWAFSVVYMTLEKTTDMEKILYGP